MLKFESVTAGYGDILAIEDVSFNVPEGLVFALLGANGAGKTTTMMTIAGHVSPKSGSVFYDGEDLVSVPTSRRVAKGIAIVPEGRRLFPDLTVAENLVVGGYSRSRAEERARIAEIVEYFPRLGERIDQRAGSLSGGEQQMLAMGRALMASPRLLLVDELSLGLMPKVVNDCYAVIARLRQAGLTILLVEQNTERALAIADRVCVLESGHIAWSGSAKDARQNEALVQAYLGVATETN